MLVQPRLSQGSKLTHTSQQSVWTAYVIKSYLTNRGALCEHVGCVKKWLICVAYWVHVSDMDKCQQQVKIIFISQQFYYLQNFENKGLFSPVQLIKAFNDWVSHQCVSTAIDSFTLSLVKHYLKTQIHDDQMRTAL